MFRQQRILLNHLYPSLQTLLFSCQYPIPSDDDSSTRFRSLVQRAHVPMCCGAQIMCAAGPGA
jgi:hypothetical protein